MRYLLIDGNNIVHAAQGAPRLTVGGQPTHAIYGSLQLLHKLLRKYPGSKPLVLWDGASWRSMNFPEYKATRERDHTPAYERALEQKAEAKKQMPGLQKALTLLGVDQIKASNMEADDLAAICADKFVARGDKVMLISGDKDWIQLVGPNVGWFDPINDRRILTPEDAEPIIKAKVSNFRQFVEIKALMGDAGDNVPGVGGVGAVYAQQFIDTWGSWANFSNMIVDGTIDVENLPKALRNLVEDEDKQIAFGRNLELVDLRTTARPAPINLRVIRGEPSRERFEKLCRVLVFKSILKELDHWLSSFPAMLEVMEEAA